MLAEAVPADPAASAAPVASAEPTPPPYTPVDGSSAGAVDLGGGALQSAGAHDLFVAKYTGDGKLLWAQRFGGSGDDAAYGVTVALSGEITVAGTMQGSFSAGATTLTSAGGYDVLLLHLQPSGAPLWAQRFGSTQDDAASSVASALSRDVVVTGYFSGPASFGGNQLNTKGGADIFLASYDAAGQHQWSQRHGGPLDDFGNRVDYQPQKRSNYRDPEAPRGGGHRHGNGGNPNRGTPAALEEARRQPVTLTGRRTGEAKPALFTSPRSGGSSGNGGNGSR